MKRDRARYQSIEKDRPELTIRVFVHQAEHAGDRSGVGVVLPEELQHLHTGAYKDSGSTERERILPPYQSIDQHLPSTRRPSNASAFSSRRPCPFVCS